MSRRIFSLSHWCVKNLFPIKNLQTLNRNVSLSYKQNFHVHKISYKASATLYANRSEEVIDADDAERDSSVLNIISYNREDPVIDSLLSSTTVQDVLNTLSNNEKNLKKEHLVQSALVLWHLQNVFVKIQTQLENITDVTEAKYVQKLKEEPKFQKLLKDIEKNVDRFDIDELTCSLLYLSKMEVDLRSNTIQCLLSEIEKKFKTDPNCATLSALSRACVSIKYNQELWCQFFLLNLVPLIESKMSQVSNSEDLRLLTICMMHTHHLLPAAYFEKYKEICRKMIRNKTLTADHGKTTAKIMTFMSLHFWAYQNTVLLHELGQLLQGRIHKLESKDVILLQKSFQACLEPADLMEEIAQVAKDYLRSETLIPDKNLNAGMLLAVVQYSSPTEKISLAKYLRKELNSEYFVHNMMNFFQILRSLKTSDHKLCHLYWSKAIQSINQQLFSGEPLGLLRIAHRYMYFNNNLGGSYRHFGFEKQMTEWLLNEIYRGSMGIIPNKLARGVSFLIAYCNNPKILIPVMDKLIEMGSQLSHHDCVVVSRGVEIMLDLMRRKQIHPEIMQKLVNLDTCLNECAWRHLEQDDLNIAGLNNLLRTYHNRRASPESLLIDTIVQKLGQSTDSLNSRIIREVSYCSAGLSYLIPNLMDRIVKFVVEHEERILAETAERTLSTMYYLGFHPKDPEFFNVCARLLIRDKERLSCLGIIQTGLALSYYNHFPSDLVGSIFSVNFLERIDRELAACYSKANYPVKVRYSLMELNRSVCLDLPQLDVPWFHTKYCEEIKALDPQVKTVFHDDVGNQLKEILKGDGYVQTNVYSPYGYKINFLVLLDSVTKPLRKSESKFAKHRVAFILHSERQFTLGERRLKGPQQLRQRHLEMLGYRVVPISEFVWNAMYLTEVEAKRTFLAEKLWPEREEFI